MEYKNSIIIKIDQDLWITRARESLQMVEEIEEEQEIPICVFSVPKELLVQKPEAYVPQSVSIGPYHHWRCELYEMERYKFAAARRFQKTIAGRKFEYVVEELAKFDWQMRSYYHKYLDYKAEALAWLMALDASFLLQCLEFYVKQGNPTFYEDSSDLKKLLNVLDPTGRSATHNQILRDLMMLENQIPLFLVQKLLHIQLGSQAAAEERLCNLVRLACIELSPFNFMLPDNSRLPIKERGHILEVLYYSIVPNFADDELNSKYKEDSNRPSQFQDTKYITPACSSLWNVVFALNVGVVQRVSALAQTFLKYLLLLTSALGNLPVLRAFKGPLTVLFRLFIDAQKADKDGESKGESSVETPPTRDELTIPCVAELFAAGIKFVPTKGDLTTIRFNETTCTLYLPQVKLDTNTEVILRNLVAFESAVAPGAFFFARYTDLMNGIIDNEEDVRLLRSSGIIYNHLENDGKVASLSNGMGKCVKLTKVKYLDEVIKDVNKYYNSRVWSVASVKKFVFGSRKVLAMVAAGILLLVTCLQAFCSMYNCEKWFNTTNFLQE